MANSKMTFAEFAAYFHPEDCGPKKRGRKSRCPTKEELEYMYIEKQVRVEKIAEYFSVQKITVYKWLNKYGLTEVKKGESKDAKNCT